MLVEFQKALADLTASPRLCREMRREPGRLRDRYQLTDREWRQLAGVVASKGMEANCMLYRANRLAPVALNLPETCDAIRDQLDGLVSAYWESEPTTDVHFLVEADRFCRFLQAQPGLPPAVRPLLDREHAVVAAKLEASREMARLQRPVPAGASA
jgi:hypothetical protein